MARILIVDDSNFSRRTLRAILEADGHDVSEAADGLASLELYFLEKPDLVLLDLTMKDMSGLEVLRKLRELDPAARVIVASADIQSATRAEVQAGGALAFITKPFQPSEVVATVHAHLSAPPPCN